MNATELPLILLTFIFYSLMMMGRRKLFFGTNQSGQVGKLSRGRTGAFDFQAFFCDLGACSTQVDRKNVHTSFFTLHRRRRIAPLESCRPKTAAKFRNEANQQTPYLSALLL